MDWYEKFIIPIWEEYKLPGFILILLLLLGVSVVIVLVLNGIGVDVAGYINRLLIALGP